MDPSVAIYSIIRISIKGKSVKYLSQLLFHYGAAHLVDLLCRLVGKKPFLVKISNMMQKSTKVG